MHAWEAIQETLEYIEANIGEPISMETLAGVAGLSPFYYQRLFSRLVKKPVREYIKLRRLARAGKVLADKNQRILDVALEFGFGSHESFTRAFKSAYHMTPDKYREHPVMLNHYDKPDLLLSYTMIDEDVPLISDGLVLEFGRRTIVQPIIFYGVTGIIPIAGQMPVGEATGVDLPGEVWNNFHRQKYQIPHLPDAREVGVAYFGDAPEGSFTYFAGIETEGDTGAEGFARWELPPREYVICSFEAETFEGLVTTALNKAVKYSRFWLEEHCLTMDAYSPEIYYKDTPEIARMELWMPVETLPACNV